VALHDGLLQAAAREPDLAVLAAVLRALHALSCAAPYGRLPPTLLPRVVSVMRCRTHALTARLAPSLNPFSLHALLHVTMA
jgi:hypothetical protein